MLKWIAIYDEDTWVPPDFLQAIAGAGVCILSQFESRAMYPIHHFSVCLTVLLLNLASEARGETSVPDFNRDVRPVLSQYCFKCHGMDEHARKSGLRLDQSKSALDKAKSGDIAIVPGKPEASELINRINSTDEDSVMPPPSTKVLLPAAAKEMLRKWIAGGADYQPHWAYQPPKQAALPMAGAHPVDAFIRSRLEKEHLSPSPEADRYTLARRVYLDIIGLPPTPEQADAFVKDTDPKAYEKLVDSLLAAPQYGERWARRWLDLARYADTNGYEKDRPRQIWPYRDWVVQALNADMPFDQFTIKQLAGDMLKKPAPDDLIATGFHRNTMLNEEGGIDPLEFRYYAVVDRTNVTGTAWMGLTVGCCQCHTHKFDPILHTEYYQLMAFLNNASEPAYEIVTDDLVKQRAAALEHIKKLERELPDKWPVGDIAWKACAAKAAAASGCAVEVQGDGSLVVAGNAPDKDSYTVTFETDAVSTDRLRLEVLREGGEGPGRTAHGNFVLSEISVSIAPKNDPSRSQPVKISRAEADYSQHEYDVAAAIDGNPLTGWAVDGAPDGMKSRGATFHFATPLKLAQPIVWTVRLDHNFGTQHTLKRFRVSLGAIAPEANAAPIEQSRKVAMEKRFAEWEKAESGKAVHWQVLRPVEMKSSMPQLTQRADGSILAAGDVTKSETYDLKCSGSNAPITALRLEALPDPSLPNNGPGMAFYEGPGGAFFLSEFQIMVGGQRVKVSRATQSFPKGGDGAMRTQDENMSSGWSTDGGEGMAHSAVFVLEKPIPAHAAMDLKLQFERHFACPLGCFRISVTGDTKLAEAREYPAAVEDALAKEASARTEEEKAVILQSFLESAPELSGPANELRNARKSLPIGQSTLVMKERPASNPRSTQLHYRGEFLSTKEEVHADVPAFLPALPPGSPKNRLTFAQWLVSPTHPLTARVTVNRQWQAFFGRGLVRTLEDFGYQGDPPSHPELLDWLAVEFMKEGWSMKKLHRLIVTSATYKQSAVVTPQSQQLDPQNILLSHGPRFRLEAEIIRDAALQAAGVLSLKMGGPGVYPPQPVSITTDGTYGGINWTASQGEDRFRRTLYTFTKRTAPFAMATTFDGPTGESCLARREISNSPLQALTLLNDTMFMEAAQALARRVVASSENDHDRIVASFRYALTRPPTEDEVTLLKTFVEKQRERLKADPGAAAKFAGKADVKAPEIAAWTALARAILNFDEAITHP